MFHNRLDRLSVKLLPLEHKIWRELKGVGLVHKTLIIAVSGGLDSVVLTAIFKRLSSLHRSRLILAHVHHGHSKNKKQNIYRDQAQKFTENLAQDFELSFKTNNSKSKKILLSENEFREFRYEKLLKWQKQLFAKYPESGEPLIVLAHHADDLFETQMIRFIRGVGPQGLSSMTYLKESKLRPLIQASKSELNAYAVKLNLKWIDDPSNYSADPLRNWMRQHWLKDLERKCPGAKSAMMRSFSLLAESINSNTSAESVYERVIQNGTIDRTQYLALSRVEKNAILANFLKSKKIKNYSHGHIEEIRRRLDNSRGEYTFTLLKHVWQINAGRILAAKV